jgi:hypothetical protein
VKAILPDKVAGLGVAVAAGLEVLVGLGVDVGPLLVGVAVAGKEVDVAAEVAVTPDVGVVKMMGVHVGVAIMPTVVATAPAAGMISIWPGRINAASVIPLAAANASTVTPNRVAISDRVSPISTA